MRFRRGFAAHQVRHVPHHRVHVEAGALQQQFPLRDAREVQQIVDEPRLQLDVPPQQRQLLAQLRRERRSSATRPPHEHRHQRRAQLVRKHREELILRARSCFRLFLGAREFVRQLARLGHVGVRAKPALHFPGPIPDRHGAREEPPEAPVFPAQRKRVLPHFAALQVLPPLFRHLHDVLGMVHFLPAPALHLRQRGAGEVKPPLVIQKIQPASSAIHASCGMLSARSRGARAFAQRLFRGFAVGDVAQRPGEKRRGRARDRGDGKLHRKLRPVGAQGRQPSRLPRIFPSPVSR